MTKALAAIAVLLAMASAVGHATEPQEFFPRLGAEYIGFYRVCPSNRAAAALIAFEKRAVAAGQPYLSLEALLALPADCRAGIQAVRPLVELQSLKRGPAWNLRLAGGAGFPCGVLVSVGSATCRVTAEPARYFQGSAFFQGRWQFAIIQAFGSNLCAAARCRLPID